MIRTNRRGRFSYRYRFRTITVVQRIIFRATSLPSRLFSSPRHRGRKSVIVYPGQGAKPGGNSGQDSKTVSGNGGGDHQSHRGDRWNRICVAGKVHGRDDLKDGSVGARALGRATLDYGFNMKSLDTIAGDGVLVESEGDREVPFQGTFRDGPKCKRYWSPGFRDSPRHPRE